MTSLKSSSKVDEDKIKSQLVIIETFAEGSLTAFTARLEVVWDEPLPVVAAVVGNLVRGHILAVGGALVVPPMAPHVSQAVHRDKG